MLGCKGFSHYNFSPLLSGHHGDPSLCVFPFSCIERSRIYSNRTKKNLSSKTESVFIAKNQFTSIFEKFLYI